MQTSTNKRNNDILLFDNVWEQWLESESIINRKGQIVFYFISFLILKSEILIVSDVKRWIIID